MSADTVEPLTKIDSAISGLSSSPPDSKGAAKGHRRASSSAAGVYNIADLGKSQMSFNNVDHGHILPAITQGCKADKSVEKEGKELQIAKETQRLNW